jgi:hypothetical protein
MTIFEINLVHCLKKKLKTPPQSEHLTGTGKTRAADQSVDLRPSACWDRGFESHRGHGCWSLVSVCAVR